MPFEQKVLEEVTCPRCNAVAQHRLEDRGSSVIIYLYCDKCKLRRHVGITTRKALKLKKRQTKLRESLDQTRNPRVRLQIEARLMKIEREIRNAEMGL